MSFSWQRRTRLVIAVAAVIFAAVVASTMRERKAPDNAPPVQTTDPEAIVESSSGYRLRVNRNREDVRIHYDHLLAYGDGSSRMSGVRVLTDREGGRQSILAHDARIGKDESVVVLSGDVLLTTSDGLEVRADEATYTVAEGLVQAAGPVAFARGRMSGTGIGMTYQESRDTLTILDSVHVAIAPDSQGKNALDVTAAFARLTRPDKVIVFDGGFQAGRMAERFEADTGVAHLSEDEERLEALELRGNARIQNTEAIAGGLKAMSGGEIDLTYATAAAEPPRRGGRRGRPRAAEKAADQDDAPVLERAVVRDAAVIELAGERDGRAGGRIEAAAIQIGLAPDGATPTSLSAQGGVTLTMPGEGGSEQTIRSRALESRGDDRQGLTAARFEGDARYDERGPDGERSARSARLEAALSGGLTAVREAVFEENVEFTQGDLKATAPRARYFQDRGALELRSVPAGPAPYVVNPRLSVIAARIDLTLEGPGVKASGDVKSELRPAATGDGTPAKTPSMLKPDRIVTITAGELDYDGDASRARYAGDARLWQDDTSIKAASIVIDDRTGDLSADGPVTTITTLVQARADGRRDRNRATATSRTFRYEEALRRATYTGEAHLSGVQGDLEAERIELYLLPGGEELERVEAYESVTLTEGLRRTTGARLTYFSVDERYVVTGTPVTIVDECGHETIGQAVTKRGERIVVDGREQIRTQSKGGSKCP